MKNQNADANYEMFLKLKNKNKRLIARYGSDKSAEIFIAIMRRLKLSVFNFLAMVCEHDINDDNELMDDAIAEYKTGVRGEDW